MAAKGRSRRRVQEVSGPDITDKVVSTLRASPGVKTSDLAERLGVPQLQVRSTLMDLESKHAVHRTGATRGTRWYLGRAAEGGLPPEPGDELPPEAGDKGTRRGPKEKVLDDNRNVLGTRPDSEIASRTGVSLRTIAAYRKKHGIPGYTGPRRRGGAAAAEAAPAKAPAKRGRPTKAAAAAKAAEAAAAPAKAPAPVAPPAAAPARAAKGGPSAAWKIDIRVKGEVVVRYVVAASLVDAAQAASAGASALRGDVVGIGWVGETL